MPRKKELPAPDSGEQDDLLSTEPQESPDAPLTEPQEEPIPTESPPDEGVPDEDAPSEEYTEFLQALNEAPMQEEPQPASSDEAEPMPAEEEPALTIPAEEPSGESAPPESLPIPYNDAVLTITARTRIKSEAEATDELWHEIRNAYRTALSRRQAAKRWRQSASVVSALPSRSAKCLCWRNVCRPAEHMPTT